MRYCISFEPDQAVHSLGFTDQQSPGVQNALGRRRRPAWLKDDTSRPATCAGVVGAAMKPTYVRSHSDTSELGAPAQVVLAILAGRALGCRGFNGSRVRMGTLC